MTSVELQQIGHSYGDKTTLDGINLTIPEHTYLVILGKCGSGKTTLLHLIAGLQKASCGKIFVGGVCWDRLAPRHRPVSMVFQDPTLFPHLNILKNLRVGLDSKTPASVLDRAVELTQITGLLNRFPDEISGGQRRKVAVAAAICQQAKLHLLDEPLASIDLASRESLEHDLVEIHQALGGTTIHVTHDGAEAMRVADQIAVLDQGKLAQVDTPTRLYDRPGSIVAANSLASVPVNQWKDCEVNIGTTANQSTGIDWRGTFDPASPCLLAARPEHMRPLRPGVKLDSGVLIVPQRRWRVRRLLDRMLWSSCESQGVASLHALTSIEDFEAVKNREHHDNTSVVETAFYVEERLVMFFDDCGMKRLDGTQA